MISTGPPSQPENEGQRVGEAPPGIAGGQAAKVRRTWTIGTLIYAPAGLVFLFGWLLWGDFAWQARERAVMPVTQLLLKQLQASDFFVGLLVGSIPPGIGLILGPIICTWSDRYRSRLGRRIPFLLIPTPFAALAIIGLAFAPGLGRNLHELLGQHSPGLTFMSLGIFAVFWTVYEIAAVTTQNIFYSLVNDVVPRELVGRFFGLFRAVGLGAGIIFNLYVIGHAEKHYQIIMIAVGLIYGLGLTLMCLMVKEGEYPPPEPLVKRPGNQLLGSVKSYFKETFSNPYYRWVYLATTLTVLACGPVNTFSIFFAKSIDMGMDVYGKYLALTFFISFCLSYFLGWLADRYHPLRISTIAIGLYAIATIWGGFFALTKETFAIAFVAHGVLAGSTLTVITPVFQLLFPKSRFGEFFSASNLVVALAYMILPPLVGWMLDATGHVYRYTFLASGVLGLIAFASMLVVHKKFMALGGPKKYQAPE